MCGAARYGAAMLGVVMWCTPLLLPASAAAHSASDAYLTLSASAANAAAGPVVFHGQWDIALRDLDFALGVDGNGDGELTWGEVRRKLPAIERYAYPQLRVVDDHAQPCAIVPIGHMIDAHADGSYAVLLFDVRCARTSAITVDYGLFFSIDPSHRGIFVMHSGQNDATALISPENARIRLTL
jgi:hypothetical protein